VCLKNSIQAGLGGVRLKPTVKESDEVITDLSDFVPVKEYKTHTVAEVNFGIVALPINLVGDGSIHLGFDLTHEVLRLVDELIVAGQGVWSRGVVPVSQLSHQAQIEGFVQDSIIFH